MRRSGPPIRIKLDRLGERSSGRLKDLPWVAMSRCMFGARMRRVALQNVVSVVESPQALIKGREASLLAFRHACK